MNFLEEMTEYKEEAPDKVLLIDTGNLSMRCLFALAFDPTDTQFTIYKNAFMQSLSNLVKRFSPNKVIFCQEGFSNWRKEIYPNYKISRAASREASLIDFDVFFRINNEFIDDLSKVLTNCLFLKIYHLEADDLIAILAKNMKKWDITLVSTDRDFYQLHRYKNFKQWDPIKNTFIKVIDPEMALMEKIISGDRSDDIPKLKNGVGPKTVAKILNNGLHEWLHNNGLQERFDENRRLIDFDFIPQEYIKQVLDAVDAWKQEKFNGNEFYPFLVKHGLGTIIESMDEKIEIFKKVISK